MRFVLLALCVLASACSVAIQPAGAPATPQAPAVHAVRDVVLASHLEGPLDGDPTLRPGERVRVIPASGERFLDRDPVVVELPRTVPYQGAEAQYFLRGYAIGHAAEVNTQFQ